MPDRVQAERNITSGAGTKSVTYDSAFYALPTIALTGNDLASGDFFALSNEAVTGFDVLFKNSGGSDVSKIFNYQAKGY